MSGNICRCGAYPKIVAAIRAVAGQGSLSHAALRLRRGPGALAAADRQRGGRDGAAFIAGGTDLMQLMKEGAAAPRRLVDINGLPCTEISVGGRGLRLGALARMSDVADDPERARALPGDRRRRCWRARRRRSATWPRSAATCCSAPAAPTSATAAMPCNKRAPGTGCSALEGDHRLHAIFGGSEHCVATHPSDLAVALVALDAVVQVEGPAAGGGSRSGSSTALPGDTPERDTVLEPGELIIAVEVPASAAARAVALSQDPRPGVVRVRARVGGGGPRRRRTEPIRAARLAAGGVGTKPWRLQRRRRRCRAPADARDLPGRGGSRGRGRAARSLMNALQGRAAAARGAARARRPAGDLA